MKVLIYHPVRLPVVHYGGTERVVVWLAQALQKSGHEVTVFAASGSTMPDGILCMTDPEELLKRANEFDVIHGFSMPTEAVIRAGGGRFLLTIEGNGQEGEMFHPNTVFVSQNHAMRHGSDCFVYNGIDLEEWPLNEGTRADRYLFLSKTSWKVKNLKGAIRLMHKMKQNFWIAGGERPYWARGVVFFKKLFGFDWKWVGSVDQNSKAQFLAEGKAMVFPILWNEPFGLVIVESLARGTPVLGHAHGSVSELLRFAPQCIMRSDQDWEKALTGKVALPSPQECREWVRTNFSKEVMAESYVKLYARVKNGEKLNAKEPRTQVGAESI